MGFWSAMKGANNVWGDVVFNDNIGTIGPENLLDNRQHKLKVTLGFTTFTFSKNDVKSIRIIASTSEWIKYFIELKNGKRFVAIFMVLVAAKQKRKSLSASDNGKRINFAIRNFEWWLFDLIYSEENLASPNTQVLYQSAAPEGNAPQAVATPSVQVASNHVKQNVQSGKNAMSQNVQTRTGETLTAQVVVWQDEHNIGRWNCPNCGYVNISSDRTCNKCGLQRVSKR